MATIQQALGHLYYSLENLEVATRAQEQKALQIQQQDLFNSRAGNIRPPANDFTIDPAILAKKLDSAIDKIEQVLREG